MERKGRRTCSACLARRPLRGGDSAGLTRPDPGPESNGIRMCRLLPLGGGRMTRERKGGGRPRVSHQATARLRLERSSRVWLWEGKEMSAVASRSTASFAKESDGRAPCGARMRSLRKRRRFCPYHPFDCFIFAVPASAQPFRTRSESEG
jgi:hypothetical protein